MHKMNGERRRILFLSNDLKPRRGGDAVASWMLQALCEVFDVTVVSWYQPDFAALDQRFGTSLAKEVIPVVIPPRWERWLIEQIPDDSSLQLTNYLLRYAKRMAGRFSALVGCTSLECDFGVPGIQYIHYPYLSRKKCLFDTPGDIGLIAKIEALWSGRLRPWMIISGYSFARMRKNLNLTNSEWTRDRIHQVFDMDSQVLYPPTSRPATEIPWEQRENGFVTIGWLDPNKRQDWIVETLAEVRKQQPDIRLYICGSRGPVAYMERLEALLKEHGNWVQLRIDLPNAAILDLLGRQKYGIHAMVDEHFGIAPASIARSGCIPFVHDSGGQVEIVCHDSRLRFQEREDAVSKILTVMSSSVLQEELRSRVFSASERFSTQTFTRSVQESVREFIANRI